MSVADQNDRVVELARGSNPTVRFSPQFIHRILEFLQRAAPTGADIAGLLFGHSEPDLSEVAVFKPFPQAAVNGRLSAALVEDFLATSRKDSEAAAFELIGWYACRSAGGLHENDLAFHNRYFAQANAIALIIRPEQDATILFEIYRNSGHKPISQQEHLSGSVGCTMGRSVTGPIEVMLESKAINDLYLRAYAVSGSLDRANMRESRLSSAARGMMQTLFRQRPEIVEEQRQVQPAPLARAAAASAESSTLIQPAAVQTAQPTAPPAPPASAKTADYVRPPAPARDSASQMQVADTPVSSISTRPRRLALVLVPSLVIAALALAAIAAVLVKTNYPRNSAVTPDARPSILPAESLQLQAQEQGDRVLLTWDRANTVVRSSPGGNLHIDDGAHHRDIPLDTVQLQNGSILYHVGSDDVSFRLEVQRQEGAALVGTMRVLDGASAVPPQESTVRRFPSRAPVTTARVVPLPVQAASQSLQVKSPRDPAASVAVARPVPQPAAISPSDSTERTKSAPVVVPSTSTSNSGNTLRSANAPPLHVATEAIPLATPRLISTAPQVTSEALKPHPSGTSLGQLQQNVAPRMPQGTKPAPPIAKAIAQSLPGSFLPPKPIRQVSPDLRAFGPAFAISMDSRVDIVVEVNSEGHVTEAHLINKRTVPMQVAFASLAAAKQWVFIPASLDGKKVSGVYTLQFNVHAAGH